MPEGSGFSWPQLLTVEPVLFLYAFGLFMNVPVSQQFIYHRLSDAKGFPYHFQQDTGCEGKNLNASMKKLEKEVWNECNALGLQTGSAVIVLFLVLNHIQMHPLHSAPRYSVEISDFQFSHNCCVVI